MKSPFPGMDPYLESRWSDVHVKLVSFIGEALQPMLPRALRARSEERILLESIDGGDVVGYRSDVAVIETTAPFSITRSKPASVATVDPVIIRRQPMPLLDRWVQIIDVSQGNRVVTAVEILSPYNKAAGRLNRDYRRKLEDYANGHVSVVEIDLLRHPSRRQLPVTADDLPADRRAAYVTCVRMAWEPETWRAYPMSLRVPLPTVPIPLREEDAEIGLALQPLIDRVYAAGGHDDINYGRSPEPPLANEDEAWATELVATGRPSQN